MTRHEARRGWTKISDSQDRVGRFGNVYPIGSSVGTVNVAGQTWELFDGYNGAMHVYSFVAPSNTGSFSGDVKDYFNFLTSNYGFPADSQYLISKPLVDVI
jgi:xyloglucan-specific endo-beta-1,4-glucanase